MDDEDDILDDILNDSINIVKYFVGLITSWICVKSTCLIVTNVIKYLHPVSRYGNIDNACILEIQ